MRLFCSFNWDTVGINLKVVDELDIAAAVLNDVLDINNLYIHDGKGNAYQANRQCDCGSHFFKDVPLEEDWQKFPSLPPEHFVACMKCGKTYPVQ
jgi:hypothetical protein